MCSGINLKAKNKRVKIMKERLQKYMARCGVASRRRSEEMISSGRVKVNGRKILELGVKIDPEVDKVLVDNKPITVEKRKIYLLLNKPKGYLTTQYDPRGRPTIFDLLKNIKERVFPVGRLDFNTKGLLLLTNDGDFAFALTHPKYKIIKTYHALVKGVPEKKKIIQMRKGLMLTDGMTAPAKVEITNIQNNKAILKIAIHEGRNHQVRRMCLHIGHPVLSLERISIDNLSLSGVPRGKYRYLKSHEVKNLMKKTGI